MYNRMYTNQNKEMIKSYAINEVYRKYLNSRVRERVGEEVEVEVPLKISKSKGALWILVILLENYPEQAPIIQVINARVWHEYIDDAYRVRHPTLENWSRESSLVKAITEINEEFDKAPPQLKKGASSSNTTAENKPVNLVKPGLKDFDDKFNELDNDQIQQLIDDDVIFNDFYLNLDGVEEFIKGFGKIMKNYLKKWKENKKHKDEVDENIEKHTELYNEYKEKLSAYEELKEKEQEILDSFGPDKVEEAIDEKIKGLDKEAKRIKKEDMDIEDFIEKYRKAKKETIKYQLMKQKIFPESA